MYGAHSLRAGFATAALAGGAQEIMIARQAGHASIDTLRMYERSRDLFRGGHWVCEDQWNGKPG
jgi:integrase